MYDDYRPCAICGSEVRLRAPEDSPAEPDGPVGPSDGIAEGSLSGGDPTTDERACTNPECPASA